MVSVDRADALQRPLGLHRGTEFRAGGHCSHVYSAQQMPDAVALLVQLLQARVHARAAEIADREALDDPVPAVLAGYGIAVYHAFRNAIAPVGRNTHADPVARARAAHPIADVVDGGVRRARRGGKPARLDDRGAALLHRRDESLLEPILIVDHRPDLLAAGLCLEHVGVLRRRVIAQTVTLRTEAKGFPIFRAIWPTARL